MSHHILISPDDDDWTDKAHALAHELKVPVYILSQLIERGETVPIATLIMDEGIDQYHHIETVYLESILKREPGLVLITKGAADRPENCDMLRQHHVITDPSALLRPKGP